MPHLPAKAPPLDRLAQKINREHERFQESLKAGLQHARTAGELLPEAKGFLPHGSWFASCEQA
jgi:hypothetical protein